MNPEERVLLERTLKLSEENNKIVRGLRSSARWANFWGFIKILIFIVPLVFAYIWLQPYLGMFEETFKNAQEVLQTVR
jgi:hypothetical protein